MTDGGRDEAACIAKFETVGEAETRELYRTRRLSSDFEHSMAAHWLRDRDRASAAAAKASASKRFSLATIKLTTDIIALTVAITGIIVSIVIWASP